MQLSSLIKHRALKHTKGYDKHRAIYELKLQYTEQSEFNQWQSLIKGSCKRNNSTPPCRSCHELNKYMLEWLITMTEQMSSLGYYTVRNLFIRAHACHATLIRKATKKATKRGFEPHKNLQHKQKQTLRHKAVQRKSGHFTWRVGCIAFDRMNRMQDDHDVG